MFGASLGPTLIKLNGKRRVSRLFLLLNALCMLFNCLKLVLNFPIFLIGRFGFGLCSGCLLSLLGQTLNDTIPDSVSQIYGIAPNLGICIGIYAGGFIPFLYMP